MINYGSLSEVNWNVLVSFFFNAMLILLAYPLIPLLEQPFGFVSKITLTELGDFNKPLLKELSVKAPGTLQHSIQVGILAEAATEKLAAILCWLKSGHFIMILEKFMLLNTLLKTKDLGRPI